MLLIVVFTGCSRMSLTDSAAVDYASSPQEPGLDYQDSSEGSNKSYDIAYIADESGEISIVDKVIKRAYLSIEVTEMDETLANLAQLLRENGGFIENSTRDSYDSSTRANVTIRVPVATFDVVYDAAKEYGEVTSEEVNTVDVTEEYFDLDTRLSVLSAKQESFTKLLDRAESIEDILKVENELNRVIMEVESIKGRMKYLDRQVDMSTIQFSLIEYNPVALVERDFGDRIKFAIKDGWGSMVNFIMDLAIGFIWLAPFLPIIVLALWLIRKLWRFVRTKRRARHQRIKHDTEE